MATSTLGSGTVVLAGTTSGTTTVTATAVAGTTTLTLPAATDTLVGKATTDTLTNKTLTSATLTGVVTFDAGTAAAPAITTTGDTNTGIFFPAADTIAFSEGGVEAMRIASTGDVGIGTTSPSAPIDVVSNSSAIGTRIRGRSSDSYGVLEFTNNAASAETARIAADSSNNLIFSNTGSITERMRINSSGNVGIGTSSPTSRLTTSGATGSSNGLTIIDTDFSNDTHQIFGNNSLHISAGTGGAGAILFKTASTERMRINSSGVLCVGTTGLTNNGTAISASGSSRVVRIFGTTESDGALMVDKSSATTTTSQVYIQFSVNGQATACGQINANGASTAAFGSFSDRRLKENITELPSQLANIMALRPVEFDYVESMGGGHQIGFIAQEVQEIYPDLVGVGANEMLTLTDMNKNDARLIKCIQEQQALITQLTARITVLEGA